MCKYLAGKSKYVAHVWSIPLAQAHNQSIWSSQAVAECSKRFPLLSGRVNLRAVSVPFGIQGLSYKFVFCLALHHMDINMVFQFNLSNQGLKLWGTVVTGVQGKVRESNPLVPKSTKCMSCSSGPLWIWNKEGETFLSGSPLSTEIWSCPFSPKVNVLCVVYYGKNLYMGYSLGAMWRKTLLFLTL